MNKITSDKATILILDGDAITLTATAAVLNYAGHECHCAQDFEAALKVLRARTIDLMICDVNIRGESGLEMCRDLKAEADCGDVPVMFVSSSQVSDIIRRVHDAGGSYYLRKPFDPYVLIELVDKALWMPHLIRSRIRQSQIEGRGAPKQSDAAQTGAPSTTFAPSATFAPYGLPAYPDAFSSAKC